MDIMKSTEAVSFSPDKNSNSSDGDSRSTSNSSGSSDSLNSLSSFLKEKRVAVSLSQKDVALKLGYSTSQFISNWERGISQPPLQTLRKIAELYNVSADDVFQVLMKTTIAQVEKDLKEKFYSGGN